MRLELARLDFVIMIQHGRRACLSLGDDIDDEAALLGNFQTSAAVG
jgi:hypothetical protein